MLKRLFIIDLIFARHCIVFIGLWTLSAGVQNVSAQQQLAQDAYAIFERSCFNCHGPDGSYRETLLIEHSTLIEKGTVVPGSPDESELYRRLLGTAENGGARMPLGQLPLSDQSIDTIRRWILAGAPEWTTARITDSRFIPPEELLDTIEEHLTSLEPFDRAFARYFTLTHLYNAGETPAILAEYRKALNKLVNSLSWGSGITNPQPIDPQATVFHIDLRHYEWDVNDGWTKIEAEYPYHIAFDAPEQTALREQLGRLQSQMKTEIPSVHVDWFIATASTPPLYHDLLSLPFTDRELETRLEVDVTRNLVNAPGVRVWRAGFNNSGVSTNNRVVERHTSRYGAYWKSYDFSGSVGTQNILTHPLNFTHDGGEVIFHLPNGLQGYYLVNASGFRLNDAPINIVSNPAASDPTVRNGISCIGCHTEGMKTFEDEVRSVIESNPNPPYNKAQALRLYVEKSEMDALVGDDMERYRKALAATGGVFGGVEPVSRFHEAFQGPVDIAYAAAVVGLETETFLKKIRENTGLQNVGLLALDNENGSVKRDTWTSSFRDVISSLDYPQLVEEPSVETQPDVVPGRHVHVPDPILRTMIAEELGKSSNAPITVEELARVRRLLSHDRRVYDLTGLQFATSLIRLELDNSRVSDLSPLTGLTNLDFVEVHGDLSDLSPLAGSINLRRLDIAGTNISDLSTLEGLTNLKELVIADTNVSDLSPVARLISLEFLAFSNDTISDISGLAGLSNLTFIHTWGNPFSDLSPLTGLTKLDRLDICGAKLSDLSPLASLTSLKELYLRGNGISDISPLAGLTGLNRLSLEHNDISDISPLAGLTNLKWLAVNQNEISDFSPLGGLLENTKLVWHINPGFPKGGTKIEGPWLWVVLPDVRLERDIDLLSEATGGKETEKKVATNGATVGKPIGDDVWRFDQLPSTDRHNIGNMLKGAVREHGVTYGFVSLYSPREQKTTMYVGNDEGLKVWLNGELVYEALGDRAMELEYNDFFPVTLQQGRNVLLVAVFSPGSETGALFGFEPSTEYTVVTGVSYAFSKMPIHNGDTFTFDIRAENVSDLAGWQLDIVFDPAIFEAIDVSEGDFLESDGGATFFRTGSIDNAAGKIAGLGAALLGNRGVTGTGSLLQVKFKAKTSGETVLALDNFQFGSSIGENIAAGPHEIRFTVKGRLATGDVNRDGIVSILDLILVAQQLGQSVSPNSPADVNRDGVVNILDLTFTAQRIGDTTESAAPAIATENVDAATIEAWIAKARLEDDGSIAYRQGIANLQNLLASLIPQETALYPNYPNPFNPETWIPYRLASDADVQISIYDAKGALVRLLDLRRQPAGFYTNRARAAYWDGCNENGESAASGVYFYQFRAGDYSQMRRMVVVK